VARCRGLLSQAMNDLSRSGGLRNLRVVGNLERMAAKLEHIEDELRFAPAGYAGWFDRVGISLEDLEKLYEYDLGLLSASRALPEYVGDATHIGTENDWTAGLDEALRDLRDAFEGRKRTMENREDDSE